MEHPKDFGALVSRFSTQEACLEYLASIRWPDGFVCSRCNGKQFWRSKRSLWICSQCEFQVSILAGSLFQDTKLSLPVWFQLIWWFMGQKSGASALSLQKNFGIGSYRTAWRLLQKLRLCMDQANRSPLSGKIEVDEVFFGPENKKETLVIAAEIRGRATGRIRIRHLESKAKAGIHSFILDAIDPGSTIVSDRANAYVKIVEEGYALERKKKPYYWEEVDGNDDRLLPRVGRVSTLLLRWNLGTYHGRIEKKNLPRYLDEFVFRYNRRTSGSRGLVFHRLLTAAALSAPRPAK
jgi:hypothetical protein